MMFDGRAVLAVDVQDNLVVKDFVKPQQWSLDVADVEPDWETDVVANEQDVFVAIDVDRLIGSCGKRKLCVAWLKTVDQRLALAKHILFFFSSPCERCSYLNFGKCNCPLGSSLLHLLSGKG